MAKLVIGIIIGALVVYLALNSSEDAQTSINLSESPEYVANKAVMEAHFQGLMDEDLEAMSAQVADSLKWSAPAYGAVAYAGSKDDYIKDVKFYLDNFDNITIQQSIYLPGLDQFTSEPDGSVRAYVHWKITHTESGVVAEPWYYGSFELEGGKIVVAVEFMDVGGLMNHVATASAGE